MLSPTDFRMHNPAVILVGADKGGVGKTTVTRAILDYLSKNQIPARAFDTEAPKGTLKRFHPDVTDIVDVTAASDQMRIFDTLDNVEATVIDVRAGLLSPTLRALRDIGFLDLAKKGEITFTVFHILGPSIASLEEIADTAAFLGASNHVLVKNSINNTSFFEWDPATYGAYFKRIRGAHEMSVPQLNELACEQVEVASLPFVDFIGNRLANGDPANFSFVLRGYVRHWLMNVWSELDRVGLPDLVNPRQRVA